ncbi:MAG: hypothetical protein WAQ52_15135 [Terriglobales bacterium]
MNMTVFLSLVAALAAIFLLKRVLTYLLMRQAGRQALAEVGKRAVTKLPEYISLSRVESPAWTNQELVRQQAEPLLRRGFQDAGVYSVDKMPGVYIRMLCQPQAGVAAHIYDHPRSGSWIEMVTRYDDGSTHAVSTLPPTGMKHPEWFRKIQADKTIPANKIYERFLPQRQQHGIKLVATNDVVREFEEVYHRLALWRQETGISAQEVAHVAVKWMKEKQANVAGI